MTDGASCPDFGTNSGSTISGSSNSESPDERENERTNEREEEKAANGRERTSDPVSQFLA
jgi:hypothetical protein